MKNTILFCCVVLIHVHILLIPVQSIEKRCDSIDVRNGHNKAYRPVGSTSSPQSYEECTVLEGDVQLVMIPKPTNSSITDKDFFSFPNLREITGSLLVYDVNGLTSLEHVFPKLRVIGGQSLIMNYALVIYENPDLLSVGLPKLTLIRNGGVRIQKNHKLCYANTVNWDSIIGGMIREVFVENSKSIGDDGKKCSVVPDCKIGRKDIDRCERWKDNSDDGIYACWNRTLCQRHCPFHKYKDGSLGPGCTDDGLKCHDECIGGCDKANDSGSCHACKHFVLDGICISKCPEGYYDFMGRRCVTREECNNKKPVKPASVKSNDDDEKMVWKAFNGKCHYDCPKGFQEDEVDNTTCKVCASSCPKKCSGGLIDSISDVNRLRKCNIIEGNLLISINMGSDNNPVDKLDGFSEIEEIMGYMKIENSHTLTNLHMFKSLRKIHGSILVNDRFALIINDNFNLKFLFNTDWPTFQIMNGTIWMKGNKMLCMNKIDEFLKRSSMNFRAAEIAPANGDQAICNEVPIQVEIVKIYSFGFNIRWPEFVPAADDFDKFLGYQVLYRKIEHGGTVSRESDRYTCSDPWKMEFLNTTADVDSIGAFIPSDPHSYYAFYVQTVHHKNVKSEVGISPIMYLTTPFGYPDPPEIVKIEVKGADSVYVEVQPPKLKGARGMVTHFRVSWIVDMDTGLHILEKEDPCSYFRHLKSEKKRQVDSMNEQQEDGGEGTCSAEPGCCKCVSPDVEVEHVTNLETVTISPVLSDTVNGSVKSSNRLKRKVKSIFDQGSKMRVFMDSEYREIDTFNVLAANVSGTHFLLKRLRHFTEYKILVEACQDVKAKENYCSRPALRVVRTQARPEFDLVDPRTIAVEMTRSKNDSSPRLDGRKITWDDPADPNSLLLGYKVKIWKNDGDTPLGQCVRYSDFLSNGRMVIFNGLSDGDYSFEVRTLTMYGLSGEVRVDYLFEVYIPGWFTWDRILYMILGLMLLAAAGYYLGRRYYKRNFGKKVNEYLRQTISANPEYLSQLDFYKVDDWELKRTDLTIIKTIGAGTFGTVSLGHGHNIQSISGIKFGDCAVKMVSDKANHAERIHFLLEASVMKQFNTSFIVKLLGVVSEGQPVLVVMELMQNGNLRDFLRSRRPDAEDNPNCLPLPALRDYFKWAVQIADGMAYLESMKFCHRDLAARNCMVGADDTVKIGDFGMARDIYYHEYYRPAGKRLMPVRWMAPESLKDGTFTVKSDVWSYGVVLYEMLTLGEQPYAGLSNDQVFNYIGLKRNVLLRPRSCPDFWYNLMRVCWKYDPRERPWFYQIVLHLKENIERTALREPMAALFEEECFVTTHFEDIEDEDYDFTFNEEEEDERTHTILKEIKKMNEENEYEYFKKDFGEAVEDQEEPPAPFVSKAEYTDIEAGNHSRHRHRPQKPRASPKDSKKFDELTINDMSHLEMPEILSKKQIDERNRDRQKFRKKFNEKRTPAHPRDKDEQHVDTVVSTKKDAKSKGSRRMPPGSESASKHF